jgi:hypothetical protein
MTSASTASDGRVRATLAMFTTASDQLLRRATAIPAGMLMAAAKNKAEADSVICTHSARENWAGWASR